MSDTATPTLDPAVVAQIAQEAGKAAAEALAKQRPTPKAPEAPAAEPDPLRKVMLDAVGGDIARSALMAADARDVAVFYNSRPEAREYAQDIEAKARELMEGGQPMDRESIWKWYKGHNFDKFLEKELATRKAAEDQTKQATVTIGGQQVSIKPGTQTIDPWAMSPEEMETMFKGQTI